VVISFPGPASATGEDVAEFHVHGGVAVIAGVLDAGCRVAGVRLAQPGEFTRRAFDAGKLDLTEIDGLADLIAAETEAQRRQALTQMQGALSRQCEDWRALLILAMARVEADLDFADGEDDVPAGVGAEVYALIEQIVEEAVHLLAQAPVAERLRDGLVVAVLGAPNAGKSSLVNVLARRDVAIVSPRAGTTRDVLEAPLNLGGYPITLVDTAGLRESDDPIEAEGIARARARSASADLTLLLMSADAPAPTIDKAWRVWTKSDVSAPLQEVDYVLSVKSGEGVSDLLEGLTVWAQRTLPTGETAVLTRARHVQALRAMVEELIAARAQTDLVLVAEHLRMAARALGRVTGRVDVEDVLDSIFSSFCIGK
jgi:tRNA modification GTPase